MSDTKTLLKGIFNGANHLNQFISPLKNLAVIAGENGININLEKNSKGHISNYISAKNKSSGIVVIHKWNDLFSNFTLEDDALKIGFLSIPELLGNITIFDDKDLEIEYTSDGILTFSQNKLVLTYKTSDAELILEGKKEFKGGDWIANFEYDFNTVSFDKFYLALKKMSDDGYVYMKGSEDKAEIQLTIRMTTKKTNTFSCTIDAEVAKDFEIAFEKRNWPIIIDKNKRTHINVNDRLINFAITTDYCKTDYYQAKSRL